MTANPSAFTSLVVSLVVSTAPSSKAFLCQSSITRSSDHHSLVALKYRSLHHGPDVEPPSDYDKLGYDGTKMSKDKIDRFGPGDFGEFVDFPSDQFDGGDSDMGLSGDGTVGLQRVGRDVSPHLAGTLAAKILSEESDSQIGERMSYMGEMLEGNPNMNEVRAQQLENWATQKEIALANRHMQRKTQTQVFSYADEVGSYEEMVSSSFDAPVEAGCELEGIITMKCPINGVARSDIVVKNPYMGFARFRAGFVGESSHEWSVLPSDGYLKQHEETHFSVSFRPENPGVSVSYFVIETEDFKKTWRVVGSTGEYEF